MAVFSRRTITVFSLRVKLAVTWRLFLSFLVVEKPSPRRQLRLAAVHQCLPDTSGRGQPEGHSGLHERVSRHSGTDVMIFKKYFRQKIGVFDSKQS
jgi:hypothetical protein